MNSANAIGRLYDLVAQVPDPALAAALRQATVDYQRASLDQREEIVADGERLAELCRRLQAELESRALAAVLQTPAFATTH